MSRTRPWERKSAKLGGTGVALSPSVSRCLSSSPSPSTSPTVLAYAGSAPVSGLLRPATFRYRGLGVEEDQEQRRGRQQQQEKSEEEEEEEDQEEETEKEEQEAEGDNNWTARTLADEERYSEDQEDENDGVADPHRSYAEEAHNYEMALQLCQDGGSQGESNRREGEEEAGAEPGEEEAGAEPGRGTWEIWQEEDAGRAAGGVHDPGRDRGHGAVEALAAARDEASALMAYFPPEIEDSVIAMTNLEADRRRPAIDGWKPMGPVEFRAYVGLLVLAGVYRSRGEACESLWDAESGISVFRAAMPLKTFRAYSSALRFDDREARRAVRGEGGRGYDKLAPIRAVWDEWCARLPAMYRPGLEVTVDERLVPFRGRCPFRQYMPSKPARYGIKIWVACDARSSYAWKMQVYTGKPDKRGPPEKHLAARVVLDLTEGLPPGRNVTCDNFFTSRELADRLFHERGHTVLGTLRANRPEIPRELRCVKGRAVGSVESVVLAGSAPRGEGRGGGGGGGGGGPDTIILSYVAKKNKNVLLLTTAPRYHRRSGPEPRPSRRRIGNGKSSSNGGGKPPLANDADATPRDSSPVKRRRCRVCPRSKDVKTKILCRECRAHVCINCAVKYCPNCAASRNAASQTPPTS
ncbi:unnamed protein product [Oreochromis niloticus]|nr:unnamed protein product [Mustela putorius furo]